MKKLGIAIGALLLTACQYNNTISVDQPVTDIDGISFVEQVVSKPGTTQIPYQKYQLDNGLTIILHKDTSDPLVHVDVTYHVGSAREEVGKSGFAHLFEHFQAQRMLPTNGTLRLLLRQVVP